MFKVGDKVRVTNRSIFDRVVRIGSIGEVIFVEESSYILKFPELEHRQYSSFTSNNLELVTENMNKYNIEIGDKLGNDEVKAVTEDGINFEYSGTGRFFNWEQVDEFIRKHGRYSWKLTKSNKMNKKIIGYKLLKDTPDCKAGTKFLEGILLDNKIYKSEDKSYAYYHPTAVENKPEWFEPIYETKPIEVFVDTLAGRVSVMKEGVALGANVISIDSATSFLDIANSWINTCMSYAIRVETFKVGCQTFSVKDIKPLQEAIKQVSE